jgi:hypothetical protein
MAEKLRRKEREQRENHTVPRECANCGAEYLIKDRITNKKLCNGCDQEKRNAEGRAKSLSKRLGVKREDTEAAVTEFEIRAASEAESMLAAWASYVTSFGGDGAKELMAMPGPELKIPEHDVSSEFTIYLKRLFLDLYIKMPRQKYAICDRLGISHKRFETDLKKYREFQDAVEYCDRRHTELLEIISYTNAMNPKATSDRIFLLKAGDPGRYRESHNKNIINGPVSVSVSTNIKELGYGD